MLELYDFRILINFLFPSIDVDNNEIEKNWKRSIFYVCHVITVNCQWCTLWKKAKEKYCLKTFIVHMHKGYW